MMEADETRLRNHASIDVRMLTCLDGLQYSFDILTLIHRNLHSECLGIPENNSNATSAIWHCWSFVDVVHRIREVAQAVPGLSGKTPELQIFLRETQDTIEFRNYIQHLRQELAKVNPFPVWGSLSWADAKDPLTSHIVFIGNLVDGMTHTGCVFDSHKWEWVSNVCLGIRGKTYNFDPIYEATVKFSHFILNWISSAYAPGVKKTGPLPVITMSFRPADES